jgi:hypothetical protein
MLPPLFDVFLTRIFNTSENIDIRAEIQQALLLSQFSLLAYLFIGKFAVKDCDSRVLEMANLDPES